MGKDLDYCKFLGKFNVNVNGIRFRNSGIVNNAFYLGSTPELVKIF